VLWKIVWEVYRDAGRLSTLCNDDEDCNFDASCSIKGVKLCRLCGAKLDRFKRMVWDHQKRCESDNDRDENTTYLGLVGSAIVKPKAATPALAAWS
jgi:hypothetical protein